MENYKSGSHTVWDCKYHPVWTTKYRYQVLGGEVGYRCRELLREIAHSKEMHIYAGSINRDHVHMLIGIPHRKHRQWSPGRFLSWAGEIGPSTLQVIKHQLEDRPHPEHGYRACLGLLQLARRYDKIRLEHACARALAIRSANYQSVRSILTQGLDRQSLEPSETTQPNCPCTPMCAAPTTTTDRINPMLIQQTKTQLHSLKLTGMLDALEQQLPHPPLMTWPLNSASPCWSSAKSCTGRTGG